MDSGNLDSVLNIADDVVEDEVVSVVADDDEKEPKDVAERETVADDTNHPFGQSNDTSDLRLIVGGRPLYVSRVVLSLVSPVFKRRLAANNSGDTVELFLPDKTYSDIVQFLCCIYPDILAPVTDDNVEIILRLAVEYEVQRLIDKCEEFLVSEVESSAPKPLPNKIVRYLNLSDKYGLDALQKAAYQAAAKTESDLLENVQDFWDLPSVTTTSVFIRRLKLLEQSWKNIRSKVKETQNHCSLYHKGERCGDTVCTKCSAGIGKFTQGELQKLV